MSKFRILLVEDNQYFREHLGKMLQDQFPDMLISEAGNCRDAMNFLDQDFHHLILMDIKLPDGIGMDLTKVIRSKFKETIVVMLTAHDLPEYREASLKSGASRFLAKDSTTCFEILCLVENFMRETLLAPSLSIR